MAKLAKLSYDGKSVEFPLVEGTEDDDEGFIVARR